ncbi:hypothetical protein EH240_11115 [Mesorhizobium tamadayense]|uniref:Uncharacterized protein n=1 Tax=Mesorhizobium tamadayense TaxID=425306 RepID=A0A3P3FX03_9HYPH|nr:MULTISPECIES: non-canonical purine NTP pyrophosphatase [Mesorhizobium]RRI03110.1 hypothetical protein EH240_11115 [Mesorhizobium tamadayense]
MRKARSSTRIIPKARQTHTFVGETMGTIARAPRGSREFYWDVLFCPTTVAG